MKGNTEILYMTKSIKKVFIFISVLFPYFMHIELEFVKLAT